MSNDTKKANKVPLVDYKTPYFEGFLYGFGTCTGIEGNYLALNIEGGTTHVHLSLIVGVIN